MSIVPKLTVLYFVQVYTSRCVLVRPVKQIKPFKELCGCADGFYLFISPNPLLLNHVSWSSVPHFIQIGTKVWKYFLYTFMYIVALTKQVLTTPVVVKQNYV